MKESISDGLVSKLISIIAEHKKDVGNLHNSTFAEPAAERDNNFDLYGAVVLITERSLKRNYLLNCCF